MAAFELTLDASPTRTPEPTVDDLTMYRAYESAYNELLSAAARLDTLRQVETGGVDGCPDRYFSRLPPPC